MTNKLGETIQVCIQVYKPASAVRELKWHIYVWSLVEADVQKWKPEATYVLAGIICICAYTNTNTNTFACQ